jgi:hypothetical protein
MKLAFRVAMNLAAIIPLLFAVLVMGTSMAWPAAVARWREIDTETVHGKFLPSHTLLRGCVEGTHTLIRAHPFR